MMPLAFEFVSPWLLLGLLAAGIPVLLHLLSSVRAPQQYFPTLRFLQISMQKTAHRRRLQHWLLLLLRSVLLALLALGVAQLVVRKSGTLWGGDRYAAVLVLDNSYSMEVSDNGSTRLERAKRQAMALLDGGHKPTQAALMLSNDDATSASLSGDLARLRQQVDESQIGPGRAGIAQRVAQALALLDKQDLPGKRIYIFSDLQEASFADLVKLPELKNRGDIQLLVVNTAPKPAENVGIVNLEITGRRVTDQALAFTATLLNSSPASRRVTVTLSVNGQAIGAPQAVTLKGADEKGAGPVNVKFYHPFVSAGNYAGQVSIDSQDDLAIDNFRRFSLDIADRVNVLIVGGPPADAPHNDGATVLAFALDPRPDADTRWSLRPKLVRSADFTPADLAEVDAVFCADVPSFTPEQAAALVDFTRKGGLTTFFLGSHVNAGDAAQPGYNELFIDRVPVQGGLLPARLTKAVGEVGLTASAQALEWVPLTHPWFEGLCAQASEHQNILTQRYFLVQADGPNPPEILMRLHDGNPLLLTKPFGQGRAVLCTSTASLEWTNLPSVGARLFMPMLERASLWARGQRQGGGDYLQNARVTLRPPDSVGDGGQLDVILPDGAVSQIAARKTDEGLTAQFSQTRQPGLYRWKARGGAGSADPASGSFAVNPDGSESQLAAMPAQRLRDHLGADRCVVAPTVSAADEAAAQTAAGTNLSDLFLVIVVLLLVVEAQISNRRRRHDTIANCELRIAN